MARHSHLTTVSVTERRLLEAAGEIFARKGFRSASVREICRRAGGANVAAISYHFGNKAKLYAATLHYAHQCALASHPPSELARDPAAPPPQRLRAHLHTLLRRFLDSGRPAWHSRLMAREMAEPTAAMNELVDKGIRPQYELLRSIIVALAATDGTVLDEPTLRVCTCSIVGQCLYYRYAQEVIMRLHPHESFGTAEIERLAEKISEFSLGGVEALTRRASAAVSMETHENGQSPGAQRRRTERKQR